MMHRKRLLLVLLSIPVVLIAVVVGAVLLVPADKVGALAAERATVALDREVRVGGISLALFPRPAVVLEEVAIEGRHTKDRPIATVRRVLLRPRILPLLARKVVVDAIVLDNPRLLVEIDPAGLADLPLPEGKGEGGGGGAAGDAAFLIRRFEIRDGRFAFRDERDGTALRLDGVNQRLRLAGEVSAGALRQIELQGRIEVAGLSAALPKTLAVPVENLRLTVDHNAVFDIAADSLTLGRLAVTLQELALEGAGTVRGLSSPENRSLSLQLAAGPVEIGPLLRSLPAAVVAKLGGEALPDADGRVRLRVAMDGRLGGGELPAVDGMLGLDGVALGAGKGAVVTDLGGDVAFSLDSVTTPGLRGRLLGEPMELAFKVRDLAAPVADAKLNATLDLGRAAALGLVPDSIEAAGRVGLDLAIRGPALEPARGEVDGVVRLDGVRVRTAALQETAVVESATLAFEGRRLRGQGIAVRMGESDLTVDLDARDWLALALRDSSATPRLAFDARSKLLDGDAILGEPQDSLKYSQLLFARMANRPVGGRPVEEVADELGLGLPPLPPAQIDGRFRAGVLRRNGLELQDVDVALAGTGDRIELTGGSFKMMGGGIQVVGQVGMPTARGDSTAAPQYPTVLSFQVRDVGAGPFFDTFTPFRDHLTGSLLLAGTARIVLDRHLLPVRESVSADGTIEVGGGRLINWPALRGLGEKLGLAQFDTLTFNDWTGQFAITGTRITLRESVLESSQLRARTAGSVDFSGALDLGATVELSGELASRIRGELANRITAAASGPDGRIPVGVRITGPATSPDVSIDFSAAASNAVAEAKEAAEAKARELVDDAARKAASKLLPGTDSLTAPAIADTAKARLQEELKKKLCRFTKC